MFCRKCGNELTESSELCPNCGARPIASNGFCHECGAQVSSLFEFCGKCGAKVSTVTSHTSDTPLEYEQMSQTTDTRHAKTSKLIRVGLLVSGLAMMAVGLVLIVVKQDYGFVHPYLPDDTISWGVPILAFGFIIFIVGVVLHLYHSKCSKCGYKNNAQARICARCGSSLAQKEVIAGKGPSGKFIAGIAGGCLGIVLAIITILFELILIGVNVGYGDNPVKEYIAWVTIGIFFSILGIICCSYALARKSFRFNLAGGIFAFLAIIISGSFLYILPILLGTVAIVLIGLSGSEFKK